ncbi:MAG: MBOAT family protein, partial [Campylobacterota bacterium]|nr:MBOAT family protein [Campylobacterota bacterium]
MNSILAWFITFNFVNISWVFFRAKEWDDALKVLKGMAGFSGVVLPEKYFRFLVSFQDTFFSFGSAYEHINGKSQTTAYIILAFIIVVFFNNSMQWREKFKTTWLYLLFSIVLLLVGLSMMSQISEFLYFNF